MIKLVLVLFTLWSLSSTKATSHLGECPPSDGRVGICIFDGKVNCIASSNQCPEGYRCCNAGCNSICKAVTVDVGHPGSCKTATGRRRTICKEDRQCKRFEKCCDRQGLGGYCRQVRPATASPIKTQG